MRRIPIIFVILTLVGACLWEAYRGALVLLLRRGQYAQLERWGGEAFYVPALRHFASRCPPGVESRVQMYDWVKHRFPTRFSDERVQHLELLPTGELALLLRKSDDECRVVVVDPDRSDLQTAASEPVDHNAWQMRWQGDWVFLDGGGSMTVSLAVHREGSVLRLIPTVTRGDGAPYFWGHCEFEDLDGDGIPEVVSIGSDREPCPGCGRNLTPSEEIWRLIDGSYQEWSMREYWCPACCMFPWSD